MELESYAYSMKHPFVYKWHVKDIRSTINSISSEVVLSRFMNHKEIVIKSSEFSAGAKIKDSWFIQLGIFRREAKLDWESCLSISLRSKNGNRQVRTTYGIYILNNEKKKIVFNEKDFGTEYSRSKNKIFMNDGLNYDGEFKVVQLLAKASSLIQNNTLTIGVDLIVYDDYVTINNPINSLKDSERTICDDFKDLLVSREKSDIVIKVGDKKFDAHKLILTVRSSIFDAMFSHDTKENKKNEITIPDIDPEVFQKVLEFVYTDKIDNLKNFAEELLEASDKYHLRGLKDKCEEYLARNFTVENALRVMIFAERHSAKRLKEAATTYILVNFAEVKNTEDFKTLKASYPSLFVELLQKKFEEIDIK